MSNETIFREVDEELRSDRMRNLWRRFGPFVIGAAVVIVVLVAVNEGWSWWQKSTAARSSDQFYAALELAESGDPGAAREALEAVVAEGSGAYPTLARFREASLLAANDSEAAIAAYDALATATTDSRLRDLALVLAGYLIVDSGDVAAVQQRVGGLAAEGNPMRHAAREIIGLTQYRAGDAEAALATFESLLADPLVSQELAGRVQIYLAQIQAQGVGAAPVVEAGADAAVEPANAEEAPAAETPTPVTDGAAEAGAEPGAPATEAPAAGN